MTKKIEIISIDLNLDLDAEIKRKVENISADIQVYTDGLIAKAGLKQQKTTKKQQEQQLWDIKLNAALKLLLDALQTNDPWVTAETLLQAAELTIQYQLTTRMKTFLRRTDEWILIKATKNGKQVFSLQRFGKID